MATEKIDVVKHIYKSTGHCFSKNVYQALFPEIAPTQQQIHDVIDNINALRGLGIANTAIKTAIKMNPDLAGIMLLPHQTTELNGNLSTIMRDFIREQRKDRKVVTRGQEIFNQSVIATLPPEHWQWVKFNLWGIDGFAVLRGVGEWQARVMGAGKEAASPAR